MKIEFTVDSLNTNFKHIEVTEDELLVHIQSFVKNDELEGNLVFQDDGQPLVEIHDALWLSVKRVCFDFVTAVIEDNIDVFLYRHYAEYDDTVLIPKGGFISVMRPGLGRTSFRKEPCLRALYACGTRYLAFVKQLRDLGRPDEWSIERLEAGAVSARQALEKVDKNN